MKSRAMFLCSHLPVFSSFLLIFKTMTGPQLHDTRWRFSNPNHIASGRIEGGIKKGHTLIRDTPEIAHITFFSDWPELSNLALSSCKGNKVFFPRSHVLVKNGEFCYSVRGECILGVTSILC